MSIDDISQPGAKPNEKYKFNVSQAIQVTLRTIETMMCRLAFGNRKTHQGEKVNF